MSLRPSDVGSRVSVRRHLRDGRAGLGDVVGRLHAWDSGQLVIIRRDGTAVTIPEADVVAAKVVPEPPVRKR